MINLFLINLTFFDFGCKGTTFLPLLQSLFMRIFVTDKKKIRKKLIVNNLRIVLGDPFGARTQDPNIKSVVLYRLS